MDSNQIKVARSARGFLPDNEGEALYEAAISANTLGPFLEVGSYCGKSAIYLGFAAQKLGKVLFALDHHRGSEENQSGWEHHEPDLVDGTSGKMDTLPIFRQTIDTAGLERTVVALVGHSEIISQNWETPLSFLFIDGGHGEKPAKSDYAGWVPKVQLGGILAIHDVFPDEKDGGRPPYECIYLPAIQSGAWEEVNAEGSLRVLQRISED
ncbi:MAG: class I SAM-dependent methyltransferase [Acidimicrobiales bacterium]|jgi:predicted O-methyltransferase YrrM|nr:class I SAM-dependent methyltransferase [Acidimicrobiales bacterium]MDP6298861.1 class I SAM-dependent methyltransferase [Acidimicrobiales bacterium]HJM28672.1 class I SAM-dependent methyltransferase [Acidimicrobiales bacterium]HJM97015.1 class I SAM-dependent methyltransferase [Acidimicrobiales bacterium]